MKNVTTRLNMKPSTGLPGLDHVFRGVIPGDNILWQIDSVEDYKPFVKPFAAYAHSSRQKLIYFRYADHAPLLDESDQVTICRLDPEHGFENFIAEVHRVINEAGRGGLYVFDCLSELAPDWYSDRMLGNFFMLTCPYLYDRTAVAYFAILRNFHSFHATQPLSTTAQILIDVYRYHEKLFVHPLKVQYRHSPTMYMLHEWQDETFVPVTQSCTITEILSKVPWSRVDSASSMLGFWSRTFTEAEGVQNDLDRGLPVQNKSDEYFHKLLRMLIAHDGRMFDLAEKFFTLRDLLDIRKRMIGTGLIGGKSVGMLLARAILRTQCPQGHAIMEVHDSFYIGADVFYTYLVQNGCWWLSQKAKTMLSLDEETQAARRRILSGDFPEYIVDQFASMLDYFGQSPIIVRSSSRLEDNFGNAFAGKYESVFCANQADRQKRLEDFLFAVRTVYASTMSEDALEYRKNRGLLNQNEQMALLVQRVSGANYGNFFYPQAAGVAFSFNPYVWHESIDPAAGLMRLVFGVGTRAVDRADDDYTRVVALNAPTRRPESNFDEVREYTQRRVDVLDLEANQLQSTDFEEIVLRSRDLPIELFATRDRKLEREAGHNSGVFPWVLTFDKLLTDTDFVPTMRTILQTLQAVYDYPVDTEFTVNFLDRKNYRINLLQCRPLQIRGSGIHVPQPECVEPANLVLESHGAVIGRSIVTNLDWLIYVVPGMYADLPIGDRYAVARAIGEIAHHPDIAPATIALLGPGRWCTTTPALGVPVTFTEIGTANVICEIVAMREDLVPDVSLGTHFFNEIVENDILYLALFPAREGNAVNKHFFEEQMPNRIAEMVPSQALWGHVIRLIRCADLPSGKHLTLNANTLKQRVVCYLE